jgi:hypothetical protein
LAVVVIFIGINSRTLTGSQRDKMVVSLGWGKKRAIQNRGLRPYYIMWVWKKKQENMKF